MPCDITIIPGRTNTGVAVVQWSGASGTSLITTQVLQNGDVSFMGSQGMLFSVSDSLSGSLQSVTDVAGLPIFEVFSDDRCVLGSYNTTRSAVVVSGFRLGIGTASPLYPLHVTGQASLGGLVLTSGLSLGNSNVTGGGIAFGPNLNLFQSAAATTVLTLQANANVGLNWANGSTLRFTIRDDGTTTYFQGQQNSPIVIQTNGLAAITANANQTTTLASGLIFGTSDVTGGGITFGSDAHLYRDGAASLITESLLRTTNYFLSQNGFAMNQGGSAGTPAIKTNTTNSAGIYFPGNFNLQFVTSGQDAGGINALTKLTSFSGGLFAVNYRVAVSGAAIPNIGTTTGTYNIDFTNSAALQTITVTGATLFSGINYVAGGAATLRINVSGSNGQYLRFPAAWNNGWVTTVPTGLATGRFALLTLNTFTANDSGVMVAYAVAP